MLYGFSTAKNVMIFHGGIRGMLYVILMTSILVEIGSFRKKENILIGVLIIATVVMMVAPWKSVLFLLFSLVGLFSAITQPIKMLETKSIGNLGKWMLGLILLNNLVRLVELCGPNLQAIQLDMTWPDAIDLIAFRQVYPDIELLLQVHGKSLFMVNNDPEILVAWLQKYEGSLDYVLLDKSKGTGLGMDAKSLQPFVEVIRKFLPNIGVAIAGGLGPDTMHLAEPLVQMFFALSIDAQGQLRASGDSLTPIDWQRAENYLIRALQLFKKYAK